MPNMARILPAKVKEVNPLKQGLKHQQCLLAHQFPFVKEVNPLKQGLKPTNINVG